VGAAGRRDPLSTGSILVRTQQPKAAGDQKQWSAKKSNLQNLSESLWCLLPVIRKI